MSRFWKVVVCLFVLHVLESLQPIVLKMFGQTFVSMLTITVFIVGVAWIIRPVRRSKFEQSPYVQLTTEELFLLLDRLSKNDRVIVVGILQDRGFSIDQIAHVWTYTRAARARARSAAREPGQAKKPPWRNVLGVSDSAGVDEVKRAYRLLARSAHPDKGGDRTQWDRIADAYSDAKRALNFS